MQGTDVVSSSPTIELRGEGIDVHMQAPDPGGVQALVESQTNSQSNSASYHTLSKRLGVLQQHHTLELATGVRRTKISSSDCARSQLGNICQRVLGLDGSMDM